MSDEQQTGNTENQVNGGRQGAVVQAGAISGGVHLHLPGDGFEDTESPLIVTVERSGKDAPYDEQTVLLDTDPPEVMVREGSFRVTVESSLTGRAVILRRMRPVVLSRRPARRACHGLITPPPTFRRVAPRHFSTDLNKATPQLQAEDVDFPFSVSATDVEEFIITPAAGGDEILWHLEIDWLCAGRHGTTIVDDHGQPFALYPRSGPRLGCGYEHVPGCPAPRLALESTQGTVLVGCSKWSPHGRIKPDNGGMILDFTYPNESRAGEYYRGRVVNYTVRLTHGDPRNPRELFLVVTDVRPAPEAPKTP
ncbi:hypothetical protein K2224_15330 [Streptomyces sp. BHT-5-2]|uniref:hypothetical protein n=1 Tax=Streptomyces sp. BHT-5-2 TaxID=2866715 RepID=UPI001C8F1A0B|nr:hypothetical protein [Streptomyces sp. BHT-5-2]QZL04377.1 hypothetical protein K2224_15330 [Streptomyces sp. BHT-5-2]